MPRPARGVNAQSIADRGDARKQGDQTRVEGQLDTLLQQLRTSQARSSRAEEELVAVKSMCEYQVDELEVHLRESHEVVQRLQSDVLHYKGLYNDMLAKYKAVDDLLSLKTNEILSISRRASHQDEVSRMNVSAIHAEKMIVEGESRELRAELAKLRDELETVKRTESRLRDNARQECLLEYQSLERKLEDAFESIRLKDSLLASTLPLVRHEEILRDKTREMQASFDHEKSVLFLRVSELTSELGAAQSETAMLKSSQSQWETRAGEQTALIVSSRERIQELESSLAHERSRVPETTDLRKELGASENTCKKLRAQLERANELSQKQIETIEKLGTLVKVTGKLKSQVSMLRQSARADINMVRSDMTSFLTESLERLKARLAVMTSQRAYSLVDHNSHMWKAVSGRVNADKQVVVSLVTLLRKRTSSLLKLLAGNSEGRLRASDSDGDSAAEKPVYSVEGLKMTTDRYIRAVDDTFRSFERQKEDLRAQLSQATSKEQESRLRASAEIRRRQSSQINRAAMELEESISRADLSLGTSPVHLNKFPTGLSQSADFVRPSVLRINATPVRHSYDPNTHGTNISHRNLDSSHGNLSKSHESPASPGAGSGSWSNLVGSSPTSPSRDVASPSRDVASPSRDIEE